MRNVTLEISNQGEVILSKRLLVAKPSEMIAVDLPADKEQALKDKLTIAIREEA